MLDLSSLRRHIGSRFLQRLRTTCSSKKRRLLPSNHDTARLEKRRRLLQRLRSLLIEPLEGRIATGSLIPVPLAMISEALDNARYPIPAQSTIDPVKRPSSPNQQTLDQRTLSQSQSRSSDPASTESPLDPNSSSQPSSQNVSSPTTTPDPQASSNSALNNERLLDPSTPSDRDVDSNSHPIPSADGDSGGKGGGSAGSSDRMTTPQSLHGAPIPEVPRPDLQVSGGSPNPQSSRPISSPPEGIAPSTTNASSAASATPSTSAVGSAIVNGSSSAAASSSKSSDRPTLQQAPPGKTVLLNDLPSAQWRFTEFGGRGTNAGREQQPRWIVEGNSFLSQLELDWSRPADVDRVEVRFRTKWDSDAATMKDAFEIAWLDAGDRSLVPVIQPGRDSFFNFSEGESPLVGATTSMDLNPFGGTTIGTVGLDVSTLPAGMAGTFVFRLINNDNGTNNDDRSYVRLDLTNSAPDAIADVFETTEDQPIRISSPGVLVNDRDVDDDPLRAVLVTATQHGTISLSEDGSFNYVPTKNFSGLDTFVYQAHDGTIASAPCTVTILVSAVNDPPVGLRDHYSLSRDKKFVIDGTEGVLRNDFDPESSPLKAVLVRDTISGPMHGVIDLRDDGGFTYTPDTGWTGNDFFTYRVSDGEILSEPIVSNLRITPSITGVFVDSTRWNPSFAFAASGYPVLGNSRNLPWFNINQVRIEFSEPVQRITKDDFTWLGSPTLARDYNKELTFEQPTPSTLVLTLGGGQTLSTEKILLGLRETIRDLDGNSLDGDGNGQGGDPANLRFQVVPGDVDGSGLVLSNDVTLVRNSQIGIGTYDPFRDVNGSSLILSDDVTLTRNNQLGMPSADRNLASLSMAPTLTAISSQSKFFTVDRTAQNISRYRTDGTPLPEMRIEPIAAPRGIAMTERGDMAWVLASDHTVHVIETATHQSLGFWNSKVGDSAQGISVDGSSIWTVDSGTDLVYQYTLAADRTNGSLTPDFQFQLDTANFEPTGITTDGKNLWISDSASDAVFVYRKDGSLVGRWGLDTRNSEPSGLTLNPQGGEDLWVVDRADAMVYTYTGGLGWRNDSHSASSSFALSGSNQFPEDIADPPPAEPLNEQIIVPDYQTTSFSEINNTLYVDLQLKNQATYAMKGPLLLGVLNLSRGDVELRNRDGISDEGIPYVEFLSASGHTELDRGENTETIHLAFHNPSRNPFTYQLVLFPQPNRPPSIVSEPKTMVRADGAIYRYDVDGEDPDQDSPLIYDLLEAPDGMSIDPNSGEIHWKTGPGDISAGTHRVTVQVIDPRGLTGTQSFSIRVLPMDYGNHPPAWITTPVVSAYVNTDYIYPSKAIDPDGDRLNYSLTQSAAGMTMDPISGELRWRPTDDQLGLHEVIVRTTDDARPNLYAEQQFVILVGKQPGNSNPVIVSTPSSIYNVVTPNPAVGPVSPTSPIVINVGDGEVSSHQVMYTRLPTLPQADVLFLLDDTASMDRWGSSTRPGSESLLTAFMQSIDGLVKAYPETDFAFGVSRLENFALSDPQSALNRPFILNQPIYRSSDAGFERFITQALMRRAPGVGAGTVSIFEALYQASTGLGLDYGSDSKDGTVGPVNGSNLDNHHSLDIPGQMLLSSNGDVAAFNTPREFRYRILKLSDFPKLPSFNLNAPIILSGKFDEPRIAQGWRFQSQASHQKLRLSAATEQGSAEWLAFSPTGERIYQGSSNVPIEITLATPGEYTLVLNSLSNSPLNYNSTLSLQSYTQPLILDRNLLGKIQYQKQTDNYTFSLSEYTSVMVDVMNRAPGVQWTLRAPDGVAKASNRFSDAVEGTDAANDSGDTLLRLAPGDYQLEINATGAAAWPHEAIDYAIALRTLPAIAHPPLAPNGSLSIPHATDRPSSTSFYGFSTTTAGQVISLEIPERSVLPNVRQWIVDADGNVLHKYSNYSNSSNGTRPTQFLIASAGDYTVLFDGDINREGGNLSTTIRLNCNSVEVPPTSISVSPNQIIDGTVTSPSGVNYKISVPSNGGDLYFDPLSLSPTLGWTLLAPSGAIVARSKWNGDELITDDALPKLSNKPLRLDRNGYSLLINKLADAPAGRGTPFQFRLIDLNNTPIFDAGTITQSTTNEVGTKLVRVSTDGIDSRYFKAESLGTTPWKLYAPDHALRFEVDGTADGGYQSLGWPGSNPSYFLLDLGRPSAAIGTALATIYPRLVHHFEWSSEQLSEGTYWSSEHEHIAVENEYHFSLSNPSHFYFEPRPNSRNSDADWSILGSHGTIVAPKAFSASAADTDPQESNSVWLREGEYRLVVRSRSGDVGFRFVDLPNAGAQLTSTLINGDAGPNPEGARFFAFDGRQGDWNRIRFTEPNTRGSSGILRVRILDPFGRLVTTRFVPGPINSVPSPGYVDIDLDLPTTGRYSVIVEQPRSGNLTRSFTIQRDLKSNFPASDVRSLSTSTPHAVSIESTKLLYDATFQSVSSERYFFDGLSATGDYPTDIIFNQRRGGRHFSNSMSSSDIIHLNTTNPLLVQTYTNSVPITSSGTRGGAGFRPHSVPIIVLATDTWSDVRAAGQRKNTQPTEVIGYGESVVPQDHLSGAFLNPNPNPGEAFSFLFPDPNSSSGRIQYRDLNIGNPPNARILEDNIVRSTEATITRAIDALQDLGAYVLPVFMDYTSSFDSPEQRQIHESWYDLPQAIARLTGATNASDNDLNTGDSDFSIEPNQPLTFFFDGYRSSQQATQLTSAVSQFLQSGRLDVDIIASDPSIQIQTSGAVENLKPGQTAKFDIRLTGDGTNRTFDLLFVRKGTGNIVGSIPVQIQQPYRYPARAVDPDEDPLTFSMVGQSHGASIDPRSGQLVWTPPAPGTYPFEITVSDGRGGRDQQSWSVIAGPDLSIASNRSPNVETIPNQTAYVGNDFTYQVIATDEDRDPILYFLKPSSARSSIPDGLSIDRKTGEIHWNAKSATRTWATVLVGARDSKGGISTTPLKIQAVLPPSEPNSPPVIDPIPDLHVLAGNSIDWRMRGSDPQKESIVFRLSLGNERGAIIDPITDMFHWEPTEEHLGIHEMIVAASDPHGAVSTRKFKIIVDAPNRAPVFRERVIPGPTNSNRHYTFTPSAFDPDGDSITFAGSPTNPSGVAIDAVTGQLDWTPTHQQTGSFSIAILASDEHGGTAILEWKLEVLTDPPPNRLPVFISEPRTVIRPGFEWSYDIEAIDMDGDPVSYAVDLPDEFQFDSRRRIVWPNPREGFDPRDLWIGIQAYDGFGTSEQLFQLNVSNSEVNQPPNFTSFPEGLVATAGKRWRYDSNAVDPEKDPVGFSFAQGAPQGMSIDPLTGIVSWLPNLDQVGEATIAIQVTDIYGASNVQQFTITVAASDLPPTIDSTPGIQAKHSTEYRYNILAHDPEDQPLRYRLIQGPVTATISTQGVLVWPVPKTIDEGVLFEIAVDTGPGTGSTRQRWFVTPSAEGEDLPPEFVSIPALVIGVGEPYNYRAVATDRDSDTNRLRYSLVTIPRVEGIAGAQPMTIDPITGEIAWTPVAGHLNPGNEWVEIVADSDGKQSHQRFRVRVKPTNHEPVTQPLEMPRVVVGQIAMLDVRTDDADGDPIRYRTIDAPHGLFIDVHGRIRWATSTLTQPGKYAFHVLATDDRGAEEQPIPAWIDVVADTQSPIVSIQADRSPTRTTWVTTFYVDAADISGIASRSLSYRRLVNGQPDGDERPIAVNASGLGQHRFDQAGIYRLTARARDTFGNEGTSQLDLAVGDGSAAPKVLFESPVPYASISEPTAIVGSIQDSDLVSWTLVVTTRDGEVLRTIATGTNPIPSGSTLGWIDTTLLPTGSLQLVLKGTDLSGQSEEAVLPIQVTGMLKLGNARMTFTDATIPVAGIPITVRRTYDSLNAATIGDFGYGWKLEFQQMALDIRADTLGDDGTTRYPPFIDGSRVMVTLPDGTQEGFTFEPRVRARVPISGDPLTWTPYFKPDSGNTSALGVPQNELNRQGGGKAYRVGSMANNDSYSPVDPAIAGYFVLQTADGMRHFIDAASGDTTRIADKNGNEVRFTEVGLVSNRGRSLIFERNHRGLITKITDPRGNSLSYEYDSSDRLVSFQDRNQYAARVAGEKDARTRFEYRDEPAYRNYLNTVTDANGTVAMTILYNLETGRVQGLRDAYGNTARQTYSIEPPTANQPIGHYAVSTYTPGQSPEDPNAERSLIELNARGLPVASIQPSGEKAAFEYNSPLPIPTESRVIVGLDDRTSDETDDLVSKTSFSWSTTFSNAYVSQTVDPRGNTTEKTYDNSGQLIADTDSNGNTTRYLYDRKAELDTQFALPVRGNVKYIADVNRNETFLDPDPITGQPIRIRTQQNRSDTVTVTKLEYSDEGDLTNVVAAQESDRRIGHDLNGNGTGTNYLWIDPNGKLPNATLTMASIRNANDKAVRTESRVNGIVQTSTTLEYDSMGRPWSSVDANGLRTETLYDRRGLVVQSRTETLQSAINPNSQQTERLWNVSRTVYDEQGRPFLAASGMTQFASELTQLITRVEDIAGSRTIYNTNGQQVSSEQLKGIDIELVPEGSGGTFLSRIRLGNDPTVVAAANTSYDANNRVTRTTDLFGKISETYYDRWGNTVESRTQTATETGESQWLVTRTIYDNQGRLVATTEPYLTPESTPLGKPSGNSPAVFATFNLYDSRGRSIGSERRANVITGWTADAKSVLATIVDAGIVVSATRTEYDAQGRAYKQIAADGQESITLYDDRGRSVGTLGSSVEPASVGLTGPVFENKRVRLRSETEYNALGQAYKTITGIIQLENLDGSLVSLDRSQQRTTEQVFDAKGQVTKTIFPDGSATQKEYDGFGRIVAEIDPLGNRKELSYDPQGQLTKIQLPEVPNPLDDNAPTRPTFLYEYNEQGQMTKLTDAQGRVTHFGFNPRNQATSRTLPSGEQETFLYDPRDRQSLQITFEGVHIRMVYDDSATGGGRLSEKQFFENAAAYSNGTGIPSERMVFKYDAYGRIIEQHCIRPEVTDIYTTRYDAQGRVTQETTPTGFLRYEYDALGRKSKIQSGTSLPTVLTEVTYKYNALGRLSTVNTVLRDGMIVDSNGTDAGTPPESTTYFYDLLGRVDYTTLPNNVVEDYTWDAMDRIDVMRHFLSDTDNTNLTDNILKTEFDYTYRADGRKTKLVEKFGDMFPRSSGETGWGEGVLTNRYSWQYDNAGRLISEELDSSDNTLDQTETYLMDLVANRLRRTIDNSGTATDTTDLYVYDENDRLQREDRYSGLTATGTPAGEPIQRTTFGWHATQQTAKIVTTPSVSKTTQGISYGLGGQLEKVVTTTFGSNDAVLERTRVDYRYDPQGIRFISVDWKDANLNGEFSAGERTGSVEYVIEHANHTGHQQTILETYKNADGQAIKRISYTFGLDEITQTTTTPREDGAQGWGEGETLTFGHDGRGSVKVLFGANAAIAQWLTYSAYGELIAIHNGLGAIQQPASNRTSMLYNGEAYDMRTGLYNMRARWYSPSNARWERLDPFAGNPSDPFSYNKYGFVHSNPITGTDPTGMYFSMGSMMTTMSIAGGITGGIIGGVYATFAGTNIVLGVLGGAAIGTALGVGLTYGGIAVAGSVHWIGSLLLSIIAGEAGWLTFLTAWQEAERKQKGPPPSATQARHDYDYARLSLAIYSGAETLQAEVREDGWSRVNNLGRENSLYSYRSRFFRNDQRREMVMVYEGSTPRPSHVGDWVNNVEQGTGIMAEGWQYEMAKREALIARDEARRLNYRLTFTGHSLGGGLATAAALHTNRPAVTFNAAGVNSWTTNLSNASRLITNYRVKGEVLSTLQDSPLYGWLLPNSSAGATYWLKGRSASPSDRHTLDILPGMQDFF